jgi:peptide deformylase
MGEISLKGSPELSKTAVPCHTREDLSELIAHMKAMTTKYGGAGLAANQVGVLKRVIYIKCGPFKQVIINPVITRSFGGHTTNREECLSYPGLSVLKIRSKKVRVEGFDEDWNPIHFKLNKLAARCVQHEVDHLNGITIESA